MQISEDEKQVTTSNPLIVGMARLVEQYGLDLDDLIIYTGDNCAIVDEIHVIDDPDTINKKSVLIKRGKPREWERDVTPN